MIYSSEICGGGGRGLEYSNYPEFLQKAFYSLGLPHLCTLSLHLFGILCHVLTSLPPPGSKFQTAISLQFQLSEALPTASEPPLPLDSLHPRSTLLWSIFLFLCLPLKHMLSEPQARFYLLASVPGTVVHESINFLHKWMKVDTEATTIQKVYIVKN